MSHIFTSFVDDEALELWALKDEQGDVTLTIENAGDRRCEQISLFLNPSQAAVLGDLVTAAVNTAVMPGISRIARIKWPETEE